MLHRNIFHAAIILLSLGALSPCPAMEQSQSGYYRDSQKGWWWGDRSTEEQPEEKVAEEPPAKEQEGPWIPPALNAYRYEDVWNMHPEQFQELQEAYKKKAVQKPTYENTKDYYELSEIARKKASAFTNASQYVWQKHPELTVAKDYPITTPGNQSRISSISNERRRVLQQSRENYALVYFWKPGCSYCDEQRKILREGIQHIS